MINGMLAGLVSVTAGCSVFHPMPTVAIGLLGGAIYMAASEGFLWVQVDDPLDATAIHGVCGVWGLIAVGLFGNGNGVRCLIPTLSLECSSHPSLCCKGIGARSVLRWRKRRKAARLANRLCPVHHRLG